MNESNLPPRLSEDFNNEKVPTKTCIDCDGWGRIKSWEPVRRHEDLENKNKWWLEPIAWSGDCHACAGSGQVELTPEEIESLEEEKREKQSQIYYQ